MVKLPGLEYRENSGADISDWLRDGHTTDELLELARQTADFDFSHQESSKELRALNIQEFLSAEIPERKMILAPIIPTQGLSLLYSKRGIGKTFYRLQSVMRLLRVFLFFDGKV